MKVYHSLIELGHLHNPVITTGTFDGVHIGHHAIITRLGKLARDINGESVLITFHPHPRRVLFPETSGKDLMMICSQQEKIDLLEKTGLDHLIILEFTTEFSRITSQDFVEDILIGLLHAKIIVIGFNHHFGYHRTGNFEYLYGLSRKYGIDVEEIPEQDIQNESVSSTRIRNAINDGNIQRANAYLDHYYSLSGMASLHQMHTSAYNIKVYKVEIDDNTKLIPPDGVYAVRIINELMHSRGMLSVKNHTLVNGYLSSDTEIEFHVFDDDVPLDGKPVTCFFHKRIRDGIHSDDPEVIRMQLVKDIRAAEELIY